MANELLSNGETTLDSNGEVLVPVECRFTVHTFSDTLLHQKVHFQILKMTDTLYIWIGTSPEMGALAVAMCTKYNAPPLIYMSSNKNSVYSIVLCFVLQSLPTHANEVDQSGRVFCGCSLFTTRKRLERDEVLDPVPSVVNLIGNKADLSSTTLAQRLAKKTNKQCFVSYNIPTENMLLGLVEQRINQEMKEKPQLF